MQRPSFHPRKSAFTFSTVVTSLVLPENTQERTGRPSRVTASPTTICGASPRPFFEWPRLRSGSYFLPKRDLSNSSSSSTSKCSDVVS